MVKIQTFGFPRHCPVCDASNDSATLFMERNIDLGKLSSFSYASRKEPEFMCHQLLQCMTCDLVYVDRPPLDSELANAYHAAEYDSSEEALDAANAYIEAIQPTLDALKQHKDVLEIGAGTGIFLSLLANKGFTRLVGIEPSAAAIAAAPEATRAWLRKGIFSEADYKPNSFDLVCCFMTLEHVLNPTIIATACHRLLKPGGAFVTITHDYRSTINRVLGRRSPIIDIEHMQLFSRTSVKQLYERTGYSEIKIKPFVNTYASQYWFRLMPLPRGIKKFIGYTLAMTGLGRVKISMNVGNMIVAGIKHE